MVGNSLLDPADEGYNPLTGSIVTYGPVEPSELPSTASQYGHGYHVGSLAKSGPIGDRFYGQQLEIATTPDKLLKYHGRVKDASSAHQRALKAGFEEAYSDPKFNRASVNFQANNLHKLKINQVLNLIRGAGPEAFAAFSKTLLRHGIHGVQYEPEMSLRTRNSRPERSNYVIFDPALIKRAVPKPTEGSV